MNQPAAVPLIIAHRGASGYLPEHTLPAKALAYGMGADYLEQDLVASRDGELLVLHDLWLEDVSNVSERFPGRQRADGHFYCIDFDLDEIRALRFYERRDPETGAAKYPGRFPRTAGGFPVVTFTEEMRFVAALNANCGRHVGIYPEIKHPGWHREQGIDLATRVVDSLEAFGYLEPGRRVYLQCFDADTLRMLRSRTMDRLPMMQLLDSDADVDAAALADIASYAEGIGPPLTQVVGSIAADGRYADLGLVARAHAAGLAVHPYTFRADDLPDACPDLETLFAIAREIRLDGVFTDFTDRAARSFRAG